MGKRKHTQFAEFDDGDPMIDEDFDDSEIEMEEEDGDMLLSSELPAGYKRSWRDTEKYKEMRELYKLINDELYTGFDDSDFLDNDY